MSRSVDLFLSCDVPIDALAEFIAETAGLVLRPTEDEDRFELVDAEITAVLHRHEFVDDDDLPLSRYPYALSIRTGAAGHLGASPEVGLLRRVASAFEVGVLLVLDLQYHDQGPERREVEA